jgi:hypothetical protein
MTETASYNSLRKASSLSVPFGALALDSLGFSLVLNSEFEDFVGNGRSKNEVSVMAGGCVSLSSGRADPLGLNQGRVPWWLSHLLLLSF